MSTVAIGNPHGQPSSTTIEQDGRLENLPVAPELILQQLEKIIGSTGFPTTDRSRRLLEYLVSETLEGRGSRIKAYSIGVAVFGRPESFDSQKDPIVRIAAARLRRELEHYYLTEGAQDQILIHIPKGAYVPRFINKEAPQSKEAAAVADSTVEAIAGRWWRGIVPSLSIVTGFSLLLLGATAFTFLNVERQTESSPSVQTPGLIVKPLTDLTHSRESAILAKGLTERIIEKTSRFKELAVIPSEGETSQPSATVARYEFGGTLRENGGQLLVQTRLVDRMDGRVIWADSFEAQLQPEQLLNVELTIADELASRLASPSGILFEAERRMRLELPPKGIDAYLCTLSAYVYRASFAASKFPPVRACLEKSVADHPDYSTAWALLSLAYVDEYRFVYPPPQDNAVPVLTRAYETARRATELDPTNVRGQQALMMALYFRKDFQEAIRIGAKALALNPNDVELKGDYGYRLALSGNWTEGCRLVKEATDTGASRIAYLNTALALCHFFKGDLPAAAALVAEARADENPAYHVVAAAILAEAGESDAALVHRQWLEHNASRQLPELLVDLPQRLVQPLDRQRFMDALRKAGFAGAS
ncbi:hypothetical protein [Aestuariivirga sp.]|uniref:hypothetical protein n=1 Tax=Aestuariivirga sp. TaxID=2650926 RepID=UPI003BAB047A